ncbi:hypothetical protein J7E50_12100 [Pedobacter sp. ISL-68]|uniref:hypothetical protein n=1 Tax=unclassified Pedobacter TaxID=2628915 RepID=UPI001BE7E3F8|nr:MULTISPECIES: hypothetical protein [unclassified Pedobacter]MBT2561577.1 hypothetical protein [Pedobacter sp. ISL-64]MBT2590966.1 hypothetical protein [Pedobacter sp. ISL-68]
MNKKVAKSVKDTISNVLGISKADFGFDGFFHSEEVEHTVTMQNIEHMIGKHSDWTAYNCYEYFFMPIISKNPTKHQAIRSIYAALANTCTDKVMERNYYEKSFKHMILSKLDNLHIEGVDQFYAVVLTRDTCCNQCGHYNKNDIYSIESVLNDLPSLVRNCEHELSCHAAISVMTSNRYSALMKKQNR